VDDLGTSLTINNIRQSEVGRALDALREAGFDVEINVTAYLPRKDSNE
jgi:hypothetical protein